MGELTPTSTDLVAGAEITALSSAERVEKSRKAHDLHVRGRSTREVSQELELSEPAVVQLIEEELYRASARRANPERLARARAEYIISTATDILDSGQLHAKAQNYPQLLKIILEAQDKLDKYDGIEQPERKEVTHVTVADLVREHIRREKEIAANRASITVEAEPADILYDSVEHEPLDEAEADTREREGQSYHDGSVVQRGGED